MREAIISGFDAALTFAAARRAMLMAGAATVLVAGAAIGQLGLLGAPANAAAATTSHDGGSGEDSHGGPGGAASHATPALSGSYAFAMTVICQAGLFASVNSAGLVNSFSLSNSGNLSQLIGIADFNASTHQITFSGTNLNAPQVQLNVNGFGLSQVPESFTGPYSNTATTLTLGDSVPYSIAYARVSGGIAHYFVFAGKDGANSGCTHSGNAMRQ